MFRDPYVYLKQPPFSKLQMLGVAEGICGANGGFMYVHNALPDGPVAWVFQRMTELPLRCAAGGPDSLLVQRMYVGS